MKSPRLYVLQLRRVTKTDLQIGRLLYPETVARPLTRSDCVDAIRPCPFVGCRHNLYLDVTSGGGIKLTSGVEPWDVTESCSLDVADHGDHTLDAVGKILGVTRERIRQIEDIAIEKLRQGPLSIHDE